MLSFCLFLLKNAGLKHGKVQVPYIVSYFHIIRFQVNHVWTIRGPSFTNLKDKSGLKERQPGYMCFCFKKSFIIYSNIHTNHFFVLVENVCLKHGKVLVPYIASYFCVIRF